MSRPRPPLRVLVTRPLDQARDWAAQLQARGFDAVALPLLAIEPASDPQAAQAAWHTLAQRQWLAFVSPNSVQQFFAARPASVAWPTGLRAASPGPGTSAALRAAGVPDAALFEPPVAAGRFDSEALWEVLQAAGPWPGASVLILRGSVDDTPQGSGRDWLARQLRQAGAQVELLAVYRRAAPRFDAQQAGLWQQALAQPGRHLWLFSSSEAVEQGHERALAEAAGTAWCAAPALATHPRIAQRARDLGFVQVSESAPTLDAVAGAIAVAAQAADPDR